MKTELQNLALRTGLILLSFAILVSGIACSSGDDPLLGMLDTQLSNVKIDSLTRTMNFVVSPDRFQKTQFEEKLSSSLNRWCDAESELFAKSDWKVDALVQELVERYSELPIAQEIPDLGFVNTDSYFLQQNFWARKLAERLISNRDLGPFEVIRIASKVDEAGVDKDDDPLAFALSKLHEGINVDQSIQLAKSLRVFDWVIRNIMLLPDNGLINEETTAEDLRLKDADSNPESGIPGLGYTRFPANTMLTSRGDYVDRAKLFMTMLSQLEIDSIMLAVKDDQGTANPWAVAVHIGGKLFLFDTKLGMPIPGSKLGSIASLAELKSNPELLNSLDLSVNESLKDDTQYWVRNEQLKSVDGLVYCPPESVSYRFFELETKLVGDSRMILTIEPTPLIKRLPEIDGVSYGIWDIDFQTHQFRRVLRDAIAEASFRDPVRDKIYWYYADESYINEFVRYRTARSKYFHGLFETIRNDGNLNAIELFYNMIYKDSKIDSLATDTIFQRALAINQGKMSSSDFENVIKGVQANMRLVRRDSGFFLSQCHFDNGNYSTAANWLTRLEAIEDTARWQQAINYLKARSLEAQRDYTAAIEIYTKQESEHFHGDLIRTRQLRQLSDASSPDQPDGDEAVENENTNRPSAEQGEAESIGESDAETGDTEDSTDGASTQGASTEGASTDESDDGDTDDGKV